MHYGEWRCKQHTIYSEFWNVEMNVQASLKALLDLKNVFMGFYTWKYRSQALGEEQVSQQFSITQDGYLNHLSLTRLPEELSVGSQCYMG